MAKHLGGIYLDQEEVRLIELKPGRTGYKVAAAGAHELSDEERAAPGAVLRALLKKTKASIDTATVVLPKEQASLQHAVLPSHDPEELKSMARFEAERHIPFNVERHTFGFQVLRDAGPGGTEALLAAADGPVVERALAATRESGLRPDGLNVSSPCLMNALLFARPDLARMKTVAIVSIGLGLLDLVFASEGRILFSRSVTLGLRSLIKDWQAIEGGGAPHLDAARAAAAAKMIDMIDLEENYSDPAKAERAADRPKPGDAARKWAGRLIHELRRSYDFARREMNCPAIEAIVLAGEGAALRNLGQYLYVNLSVETTVLNPVGALGGEAVEKLPFGGLEMTLPFGGAIQGAVEGGYRIDLTPAAYHRQTERSRLIRRLATTGVFALAAIALGGAAWFDFRGKQAALARDYAAINQRMQPVGAKLKEQETKLRILEGFWDDPSNALAVLAFIQNYKGAPKEVSIKTISFAQGDRAIVKGHAHAVDDIVRFKEELLSSGLFDDVVVVEQNLRRALPKRPEVYDFWLECAIPTYEAKTKQRTRNERLREREDAPPSKGEDPPWPEGTESGFAPPTEPPAGEPEETNFMPPDAELPAKP